MTEQEKSAIKEEILEQLKFDSLLIEDLTPVLKLKDHDKFELDGGRHVEYYRLLSEIRFDAVLDKYRHVDRGEWKAGETYYAGVLNPDTGLIETSHVWYLGCKFRCLVTGTTEPPLWNSTDWEFEEGYPFLKLDWIGSEDSVLADAPDITLAVKATLYNQELTYEGVILWVWTRQSWYDDVQDTTSDDIWNSAHDNGTNILELGMDDMNYRFGKHPDRLIYTVTATVIDEDGEPMQAKGTPLMTKMSIEV